MEPNVFKKSGIGVWVGEQYVRINPFSHHRTPAQYKAVVEYFQAEPDLLHWINNPFVEAFLTRNDSYVTIRIQYAVQGGIRTVNITPSGRAQAKF